VSGEDAELLPWLFILGACAIAIWLENRKPEGQRHQWRVNGRWNLSLRDIKPNRTQYAVLGAGLLGVLLMAPVVGEFRTREVQAQFQWWEDTKRDFQAGRISREEVLARIRQHNPAMNVQAQQPTRLDAQGTPLAPVGRLRQLCPNIPFYADVMVDEAGVCWRNGRPITNADVQQGYANIAAAGRLSRHISANNETIVNGILASGQLRDASQDEWATKYSNATLGVSRIDHDGRTLTVDHTKTYARGPDGALYQAGNPGVFDNNYTILPQY
jgi:hypothetical protein